MHARFPVALFLSITGIGAFALAPYLSGSQRFVFTDVASDSYFAYVPALIHWANYVRDGGWSGWSFAVGLGGALPTSWDPFSLAAVAGGAANVVALRPWLYLARLLTGGVFFYAFLRRLDIDRRAATLGAVSYAFCGHAQTDGQWDPHANEFVYFPVLLWSFAARLRGGGPWPLTLAVAATLVAKVFFAPVAVFLVACMLVAIVLGRYAAGRVLITTIPPIAVGVCLAAPVLFPLLTELLDSPRLADGSPPWRAMVSGALAINDSHVIGSQIAGLFHKNLLGVGDRYQGWGNYLEGPGFYVASVIWVSMPALWLKGEDGRRWLLAAGALFLAYFLFPVFRQVPYGFALPYFRVSTLWLTQVLLLLGALALDHGLRQQIPRRWFVLSTAAYCAALATTTYALHGSLEHATALCLAAMLGGGLLYLGAVMTPPPTWWFPALMLVVGGELAWTAHRSLNFGRVSIPVSAEGFFDASSRAVTAIRAQDREFFRMEKTYYSVARNDALVQNFFGIKSYALSPYSFHGSSVVRLQRQLGLIPAQSERVNEYNWLTNFGSRFPLDSLVGIRYLLSRHPVNRPGFEPYARVDDVLIYRNRFALPLGVIYRRTVDESMLSRLSGLEQDLLFFSAATVDAGTRTRWQIDPADLHETGTASDHDYWERRYFAPARAMQQEGLRIVSFSHNEIHADIAPQRDGLLVVSIPFAPGWTATVDGSSVATIRANMGFTALEVPAGSHRVALRYRAPGLTAGLLVAILALAVAVLASRKSASPPDKTGG